VSNNDIINSIYKLKFNKNDDGYLYLEKLDGDSEQLGLVSPIFVGEAEPKVNEIDRSKVLWFDTSEEALSKPELFMEAYNSIVGSNRSLEELGTIFKIVDNIQETFANIDVNMQELTSEYKTADKKLGDRIKKIEDLKIDETYTKKEEVKSSIEKVKSNLSDLIHVGVNAPDKDITKL
jgi:DNA repair exonuclease SbcCD ATPase subunit